MIIRADKSHIDGIYKICLEFYEATGSHNILKLSKKTLKNNLKSFINNDAIIMFVAVIENNVVGVIMGFCSQTWYSQDILGQEMIWYVKEEYRGGSLGPDLRKALEDDFKEIGVHAVCIISMKRSRDISKILMRDQYKEVETHFIKRL